MNKDKFREILTSAFRFGERLGYRACIGDIGESLTEKISSLDSINDGDSFKIVIETLHAINDNAEDKVFDDDKVLEDILDISDKYFSYFGG